MTRLLLFSGLALALAAPAVAQDDGVQVLTTAVPFLQIEPDSRAAGMGMAGVAVADNAYAPWWNPAGLAGQEGTEVSFTHAPWLPALGANLSYEHLSAKHGLGSAGTLGGHLTYFNLGEQIATNDQGQELGTFSSYEFALGLSYGYPVTENLAVGLGSRFIYSNLTGGAVIGQNTQTSAGRSFGVDLGMKYTAPDIGLGESSRPSIAFNLANMGPGIAYTEFTEVPDAIPTTLRMGLALDTQLDEFNRLLVALDVNKIVVNPRRVEQLDEAGNPVLTPNGDPVFRTEYDPFYEAIFSSWEPRTVKTTTGSTGLTCDDLAADDDSANDCRTVSALRSLTLGPAPSTGTTTSSRSAAATSTRTRPTGTASSSRPGPASGTA